VTEKNVWISEINHRLVKMESVRTGKSIGSIINELIEKEYGTEHNMEVNK
jgi:hypothetical protein